MPNAQGSMAESSVAERVAYHADQSGGRERLGEKPFVHRMRPFTEHGLLDLTRHVNHAQPGLPRGQSSEQVGPFLTGYAHVSDDEGYLRLVLVEEHFRARCLGGLEHPEPFAFEDSPNEGPDRVLILDHQHDALPGNITK